MKILKYLAIALAIIAFDQITKLYFAQNFILYERLSVIANFFDFTLAYNKGAAFSFLAEQGGWQRPLLVFISALVSLGLIIWLTKLKSEQKLLALSLVLILGGAIGNLIDRVLYGYVIDFILLHWYESWFYPAFNVADSAICLGAGLLLLDSFLNPTIKENKQKQQEQDANSVS